MQSQSLLTAVRNAGFENLQFDTPWAARLFGITLAGSQRGLFTMTDFQQALIRAINQVEEKNCISTDEQYYTCWLAALQDLLETQNLIAEVELSGREREVFSAAQERHDHQRAGQYEVKPESIQ